MNLLHHPGGNSSLEPAPPHAHSQPCDLGDGRGGAGTGRRQEVGDPEEGDSRARGRPAQRLQWPVWARASGTLEIPHSDGHNSGPL